MQSFSPLQEFLFISFNGNSGNPPIMNKYGWSVIQIRYSGIQLYPRLPASWISVLYNLGDFGYSQL